VADAPQSTPDGAQPNVPARKRDSEDAPAPLPIPAEVLESLPPDVRERVEASFTAALYSGPFPNPIASKVTSEHITQVLNARDRATELEFKDRQHSRKWTALITGGVVVAALILILWLGLTGHDALVSDLMKIGVGAVVGAGGGYGLGRAHRSE
jgi:hypothetical protein